MSFHLQDWQTWLSSEVQDKTDDVWESADSERPAHMRDNIDKHDISDVNDNYS